MLKHTLLFLFMVSNFSALGVALDKTITTTVEQSLESIFETNFKQNTISDSCWNSYIELNADLSLNKLLAVGTIIYLPSNAQCKPSYIEPVYISPVVLPVEKLKDPTQKKSFITELKESYRFGSEVGHSFLVLNGTNSSNKSSLQLLSKSSYSIKIKNEFIIQKWIAHINFKYQRTQFRELPAVEILGNDFGQSRIELLLAREMSNRFSLGFYQEMGEGLLHEASGANLKLIKTQNWMGALQAKYSIYKGKTIDLNVDGFVGHSFVTADEKRKTSGGLHYMGQLSLEKSIKNYSVNVGVFHRMENGVNGVYEQELVNSGITFGLKIDF